jgi:hypothetical protein
MKKEIFAVGLLLFLITAAFLNLIYLRRFTDRLLGLADEAYRCTTVGQWEEAKNKAEEAVKIWSDSDSYTHILIRHSEVDGTSDAFCSLLGEMYKKNSGGAKGAYTALRQHIEGIYAMEKFSLKAIF